MSYFTEISYCTELASIIEEFETDSELCEKNSIEQESIYELGRSHAYKKCAEYLRAYLDDLRKRLDAPIEF